MMNDLQKPKLRVKEAIQNAWRIVKGNWKSLLLLWIVGTILIMLISFIFKALLSLAFPEITLRITIINYIFNLLMLTLEILAASYVSLKLVKGESIAIRDLWARWDVIPEMFFATFLFQWAISIAFFLLVIPLLIVFPRLYLYSFLILDKESGPIKSLKESWNLVRGSTWRMWGLFLALTLLYIVLASVVAIIVGILIHFFSPSSIFIIPVLFVAVVCSFFIALISQVAMAVAYRQLSFSVNQ